MKTKSLLLRAFTILLSITGLVKVQGTTANKVKIRENSVEINYYAKGNGETTLLFLHGWCIDASYWNVQMKHFAEKFSVYAIDLPGFGRSTANREQWTIEEYAKDVNAFIETLDLNNVVLIGHSMSGDIMLQATMENSPRIKALIGIDNFKFIDMEYTEEQKNQMTQYMHDLKNDFRNSVQAYADDFLFHPSTSEEVKQRIKNDFKESDSEIAYNSIIGYMQYLQYETSKLEQLNYKLHLLNSDAIPTNEEGLKKRCANGYEIKSIHATGHYPMIEKPDEFNRLLEEILEGI